MLNFQGVNSVKMLNQPRLSCCVHGFFFKYEYPTTNIKAPRIQCHSSHITNLTFRYFSLGFEHHPLKRNRHQHTILPAYLWTSCLNDIKFPNWCIFLQPQCAIILSSHLEVERESQDSRPSKAMNLKIIPTKVLKGCKMTGPTLSQPHHKKTWMISWWFDYWLDVRYRK